MRKFIFSVTFCCLLSVLSYSQTPLPVIWLKSDSLNNASKSWFDQSLSGRHALFSGDTLRIDKGILNFNPAVRLDGNGEHFRIPYNGMNVIPAVTIISVFYTKDTTECGLWGVDSLCLRRVGQTTRRVMGPDTVFLPYLKSEGKAVLNRAVQQFASGNTATLDSNSKMILGSFCLRQDSIADFKGYLAEYLVFDDILNGVEQAQVETYLAIKYGIHLEIGNYVSSDKVVLWDKKKDSLYSNHITGIGRDNYWKLHQRQSSSISEKGIFTISANGIAKTNKENKARLNDKDFLIWGDNNGTFSPYSSNSPSLITPLERKWKMKASGTTAKQINTQLRINKNILVQQDSIYILIVDRSGTGEFTNIEYIQNDTIVDDSMIVFNNVRWDTDGSGSDVFSFGTARNIKLQANIVRHPKCPYSDEGELRLQTRGGHAPYLYSVIPEVSKDTVLQWTANADSIIKAGFKDGVQQIMIKDAVGLTAKASIEMISQDSLHIDLGEGRVLRKKQVYSKDLSEQIPDSLKSKVTYYWEGNLGYISSSSKVNLSTPDLYTVTVTTDSGCVYKDQILLTDDPLIKFDVNPSLVSTGGTVNIHLLFNEPTDIQISLVGTNGKEYWTKEEAGRRSYNFHETLPDAGVYYLILKTASSFEARKIIVVR